MIKLLKSSDGQARAVVEVIDPWGCTQLLRRSIKHLYPIEVNTNDVSDLSQLVDQGLEGTSLVSASMRTLSESSSSYSTRRRRNNYHK